MSAELGTEESNRQEHTTCMADIITIVANTKNAVHKLNRGLRPELVDSPVSISIFGSMIAVVFSFQCIYQNRRVG